MEYVAFNVTIAEHQTKGTLAPNDLNSEVTHFILLICHWPQLFKEQQSNYKEGWENVDKHIG